MAGVVTSPSDRQLTDDELAAVATWPLILVGARPNPAESVRLIAEHPSGLFADLALPGNDFWLFDDRIVLFNHFAGNGDWSYEPAEEMNVDPSVVKLCSSAFEAVWQRGIPHEQYRPV